MITAQADASEVPFLFGAAGITYTNYSNYYVEGGLLEMIRVLQEYITSRGGAGPYPKQGDFRGPPTGWPVRCDHCCGQGVPLQTRVFQSAGVEYERTYRGGRCKPTLPDNRIATAGPGVPSPWAWSRRIPMRRI